MILNNNRQDVINASITFIVILAIIILFKSFLSKKIEKYFDSIGETDFGEKLDRIFKSLGLLFHLAMPTYAAFYFITLPDYINNFFNPIFILVFLYYAVKLGTIIIQIGVHRLAANEDKKNDIDPTLISFIGTLAQIGLWVFALLLFLSNLGFNINALITGLGIGGIAVAFALQGILSDLFASFSIHLDKPFKKGDFIIIGNDLGTVEHIGIKSTRIRTLRGEKLVVSNKELTDTRVHNFTYMKQRRVESKVGIVYQTSYEKTKKAKKLIEEAINEVENVKIDRVHFKEFSDSALTFEFVYHVLSGDYNMFMDVQEEINLNIKKRFEKAKIEFAYPTRTLYINK